MKAVDTTSERAHGRVRTLMNPMSSGREYNLAEQFRMHLVGMYFSAVGPEWDSGGILEADYLHHINVTLAGRRQVIHRGRTYDLAPGEAWYLPANTPVERLCAEEGEVLFFKFSCECLPGLDPLLDWKEREPRRMCSVNVEEWRTWLDFEPIGVSRILGLRGRLMWWLVEAIPEIDETILLHLASHSRFSNVLLLGLCFLREAPERANGSGRRAGKWGLSPTRPPFSGLKVDCAAVRKQ